MERCVFEKNYLIRVFVWKDWLIFGICKNGSMNWFIWWLFKYNVIDEYFEVENYLGMWY